MGDRRITPGNARVWIGTLERNLFRYPEPTPSVIPRVSPGLYGSITPEAPSCPSIITGNRRQVGIVRSATKIVPDFPWLISRDLIENRDPFHNARQSANWTCTGILAHESELAGGAIRHLPKETLS